VAEIASSNILVIEVRIKLL
jgi:hypothetical protein